MTTQNWPDPKRPGVPYRYEDTRLILDHILMGRSGKALVRARFHWDAGYGGNWQLRNSHWMSAADAALRFTYVCPVLTLTQINEMLAAERERCAEEAEKHRSDANVHTVIEWDIVQTRTANGIAYAIRNLGAAP